MNYCIVPRAPSTRSYQETSSAPQVEPNELTGGQLDTGESKEKEVDDVLNLRLVRVTLPSSVTQRARGPCDLSQGARTQGWKWLKPHSSTTLWKCFPPLWNIICAKAQPSPAPFVPFEQS